MVIIAQQKEETPSAKDITAPKLSFTSPEENSIYATNEVLSVIVRTGESDVDVPTLSGFMSLSINESRRIELAFNYTGNNTWRAYQDLSSDVEKGIWDIYVEAIDKSGNIGWKETSIIVQDR